MNPPRAAKRGRGRPEKPIEPDFGPIQGLLAGRVLLGYRTDPEAPSAPAIRAASRKVIYHQLWMIGFLGDEHHEAADRYLHRLEMASGAKVGMRGSGGAGYGPTMAQVAALADLRVADAAIGPAHASRTAYESIQDVRQVIGWNLWPERLKPEAFRDALGRMATAWGM
ncbi:MAG: hypothetical protein ACK5QX_02880 [bacterium]